MNIPYYTRFSHRIMHNSANDIFMFCWFVNDVRQIKSKNLTVIKESLDVIGRRLPVKRTHREIVVFSAVNS